MLSKSRERRAAVYTAAWLRFTRRVRLRGP